MRYLFPLSLSLLLVAVSCSGSGEKKIISVEKKIVLKEPAKVHADRELSVDVTGMSCEHACGGAIRMALKETGAVDRCSFDFKENRKTNTAFITFDKDKISADKLVAIIRNVNDGQFTTAHAATKTLEATEENASTETKSAASEAEKTSVKEIEVSSSGFEFPNLFELFTRLL